MLSTATGALPAPPFPNPPKKVSGPGRCQTPIDGGMTLGSPDLPCSQRTKVSKLLISHYPSPVYSWGFFRKKLQKEIDRSRKVLMNFFFFLEVYVLPSEEGDDVDDNPEVENGRLGVVYIGVSC